VIALPVEINRGPKLGGPGPLSPLKTFCLVSSWRENSVGGFGRGVGIFWRCASKILLAQVFCWRI
jgi:hypothetical protein